MKPKITIPKGKCVVCGSGMLMSTWRHSVFNRLVRCHDCGSEVTELMHRKMQAKREAKP